MDLNKAFDHVDVRRISEYYNSRLDRFSHYSRQLNSDMILATLPMPWRKVIKWGGVCRKELLSSWTNNYAPQILLDVITCPCLRYLVQNFSNGKCQTCQILDTEYWSLSGWSYLRKHRNEYISILSIFLKMSWRSSSWSSSCSCLCLIIHWSQAFSREWRYSWSSADRRYSNYIWVINNFIAC